MGEKVVGGAGGELQLQLDLPGWDVRSRTPLQPVLGGTHDLSPLCLDPSDIEAERRENIATRETGAEKKIPGTRPGDDHVRLSAAQPLAGLVLRLKVLRRLSKSSIFTPLRLMMKACCVTESRLFQAQ